jgi:hypothetical protein
MGGGLVIFFPPTKCVAFSTKKNWENFGNFCFSTEKRLILLTFGKTATVLISQI